ncbi:hypothetical protein GCM10010331_15190 [Streptomyces xanthochromogenes]|nr:hypothetical protein GCM10010331_15190 [Streptomyces xanthochromogenes]
MAGEFPLRERLVVGDLRHPDIMEALTRGSLDLLKGGQLIRVHGSYTHGCIVQDPWTNGSVTAGGGANADMPRHRGGGACRMRLSRAG